MPQYKGYGLSGPPLSALSKAGIRWSHLGCLLRYEVRDNDEPIKTTSLAFRLSDVPDPILTSSVGLVVSNLKKYAVASAFVLPGLRATGVGLPPFLFHTPENHGFGNVKAPVCTPGVSIQCQLILTSCGTIGNAAVSVY